MLVGGVEADQSMTATDARLLAQMQATLYVDDMGRHDNCHTAAAPELQQNHQSTVVSCFDKSKSRKPRRND
jgi:hypothetical protein